MILGDASPQLVKHEELHTITASTQRALLGSQLRLRCAGSPGLTRAGEPQPREPDGDRRRHFPFGRRPIYSPHTDRRCSGDQNFRDRHVLHRQYEYV